MGDGGRRRAGGVAACLSALALVATGCVADPPPPTDLGGEQRDGEKVGRAPGGAVLALDRLDEGFNPHLLSDQGSDTELAAALTLPSTFRPGPGGEPAIDPALLESAEVVPGERFTVRYHLRSRAQWSDGVPVAAEDFEYLWRQMVTQPGVVDPAGYERIVAVRAGEGGKVVDVVFDAEVPQWRSLFRDLLPAHLLKDAPDGFQGGLRGPLSVSAGPFMVRAADLGRGEVEFVPNDRYWADPPALSQLLVRRSPSAASLGGVLRSGPGSLALVADTPVNGDVVRTIHGTGGTGSDAVAQLELGFSTTSARGSEVAVRRAALAAVDPGVTGRIVTGESDPGTSSFPFPGPPAPTGGGTDAEVDRLLAEAGWTKGVRWTRGGETLSLTIGVDPASEAAVTAANTVADQLRAHGIGANVWELGGAALYGDALPHGLVDAVVGWQRVEGDPELVAVSRYACAPGATPEQVTDPGRPTRTATTVPDLRLPPVDDGLPDGGGVEPTTPTPSQPPRSGDPGAPSRASGVAGVCDPELEEALGRGPSRRADLAAAQRVVDRLALRLPLVRPRHLLVADSALRGVTPPGGGPTTDVDFFTAAPTWRREG